MGQNTDSANQDLTFGGFVPPLFIDGQGEGDREKEERREERGGGGVIRDTKPSTSGFSHAWALGEGEEYHNVAVSFVVVARRSRCPYDT